MGEGGRGERIGALFIFYFLMLGDAGTYLATKITTNPARFPGGQPRNRGAAAGAAAEPSQRARVPLQTVPSCRSRWGGGGGGRRRRRRLLGEHLVGKMQSRGRQRPPQPLRCRRLGEGAEDRGRGRDAGRACWGGAGGGEWGQGCVDRTTTVLFAVLIPPVGS